jgi:peptide/nickel transport system permease protein
VWSATRRGGLVDRALSFLSFAGVSAPGFFVALLVLCACVAWANGIGGRPLLPLGGDRSPDYESLGLTAKVLDRARHLVLPVAVLALGALAGAQRTLRASLLDALQAPHVESARARGLPERRVVRRHALRSALNPLVTLFGIRLAELLSGAALVEVVFQYPGMGRLVLEATIGRDLFVVTGAVLLGALVLVAANLLADLALAWLDPRTSAAGAAA